MPTARIALLALIVLAALTAPLGSAEARPTERGRKTSRWNVPPAQLPVEVRDAFEAYLKVLRTSATLDEAASRLLPIAGGGLVDEKGTSLRPTVAPYSLRKDLAAIGCYDPDDRITRVEASVTTGHGFGASAIKGILYRIWLAKREGVAGLPAPVQVLYPEGHPTIRDPKVVGIGSL